MQKIEIPGITGKFGFGVQNEAGQRLIEFCQENALVIANTLFQQHKRRIYTWTSPDGQHLSDWLYSLQPKMEKLYTVSKNKTRSWLWLRSWTPYCKIQTWMEENGKKITRPLRFPFNSVKFSHSEVSDSVRPHRQQPTRLPRPWDSPGKNTGVGFFNLSLNLATRTSWSVPQSASSLVFADCLELLHLWLQRI